MTGVKHGCRGTHKFKQWQYLGIVLVVLLLVLGENPAREMCRRRRGEVRTPETNAATLSSATKQWLRPQMPHMPVRDDECAIVMSGRVSASPGRMEVS